MKRRFLALLLVIILLMSNVVFAYEYFEYSYGEHQVENEYMPDDPTQEDDFYWQEFYDYPTWYYYTYEDFVQYPKEYPTEYLTDEKPTDDEEITEENEFVEIQPFNYAPVFSWQELTNAIAAAMPGTTIQLMQNIPAQGILTIPAGADITLTGGFALQGNGINEVINVQGTLTLDGPTITGGGNSGVRVNGGTFTMLSGSIENNTAITGGGIFVGNGSIFYMWDGYIQGNYASGTGGGGVDVYPGGTFIMYNGTIQNNQNAIGNPLHHRNGGGGVLVGRNGTANHAVFEMHNGLITGNMTSAQGGGVAIHLADLDGPNDNPYALPLGHHFHMFGGTITGNHARINGGGVSVWGIFQMYDGAEITNNFAASELPTGSRWNPAAPHDINGTGGGVFVGQERGRFHMHGGTIANNEAFNGGGVGMSAIGYGPPHFYMHGGSIVNNRAVYTGRYGPSDRNPTGFGGGVYMRGQPRVFISGNSLIDGNNADNHGGGFTVRTMSYNFHVDPPMPIPPERQGFLHITGNARVTNNEASNGGGIYTALYNVYPQESINIHVDQSVCFNGNYARNGLQIRTDIADINQNVIHPGTVSIYDHAFTNHDIFVPSRYQTSIIKTLVNPNHPGPRPEILVGDTISYRLVITNSRENPITGLTVTDALPHGLEFVPGSVRFEPSSIYIPNFPLSFNPLEYNYNNSENELTFTIPALNRHFTLDIYFDVIVTAVGEITNTAILFFPGGPEEGISNSETIRTPHYHITGSVTDGNENPIPHFQVDIYDDEGNLVATSCPNRAQEEDVILISIDDNTGQWATVYPLPQGKYEIIVTLPYPTEEAPYNRREIDREQIQLVDRDIYHPTIIPPQAAPGSITVNVTDSDGNPVHGAEVTITHPSGTETILVTDENGQVVLPYLPDGEYTVTVMVDDEVVYETTVEIVNGSDEVVNVKLPPAPVEQGGTITVTTEDEDGNQIPGADVKIYNEDGELIFTGTTGPDGTVTTPWLPDGRYKVVVTYPGLDAPVIRDVVIEGSDEREYVIIPSEQQPPPPPPPPQPPVVWPPVEILPPAPQQPPIPAPNFYIRWSPRWVAPRDAVTDYRPIYLVYEEPPTLTPIDPAPLAHTHYAYMIGFREDGTIRPHSNMTRAEAATIFLRLISDQHRVNIWSQTNSFADVQPERWFNNAISTMENGGLFRGMPLGENFNPNQAITRAEFAAMIVNYLGLGHYRITGGNAFTDVEGHWASSAINVAYLQGWVTGFGDGTFRPDEFITRAQVAALVNRALGRLPEHPGDLLYGMVMWPDNMDENAWYFLYIQEATNSHYHVIKNCGIHETWTQLITPRNWRLLERPYSTPNVFTGLHIGTGSGQ